MWNASEESNQDVSLLKDLDQLLPESKQRTSPVTDLVLNCFKCPVYLIKRVLAWPAHLESVKLSFTRGYQFCNPITQKDVQDMLLPHAQTLRSINLGSIATFERGIPNVSAFQRLEKLTLMWDDLKHDDPWTVARKLAIPSLIHLVLEYERDEESFLYVHDLDYVIQQISSFFISLHTGGGGLPQLKKLQIDMLGRKWGMRDNKFTSNTVQFPQIVASLMGLSVELNLWNLSEAQDDIVWRWFQDVENKNVVSKVDEHGVPWTLFHVVIEEPLDIYWVNRGMTIVARPKPSHPQYIPDTGPGT